MCEWEFALPQSHVTVTFSLKAICSMFKWDLVFISSWGFSYKQIHKSEKKNPLSS